MVTVHIDIDYCHFYYFLLYKLRFDSLILKEEEEDDDDLILQQHRVVFRKVAVTTTILDFDLTSIGRRIEVESQM